MANRFEIKAAAEWSRIAGETVAVEETGGTLYAMGSELATLRLFKAFADCGKRAKQGYSTNRESFFFRLEPK